MLRFLRKIRFRLLDQMSFNKDKNTNHNSGVVRKYMLYAIGEIALVVIGILIALWISNLDQQSQYRELEKRHLENTIQQLNLDKETLKNELNFNEFLGDKFIHAKRIIKERDLDKQDSLGRYSLYLTEHADFRRKSDIYQSLVNSGEIKHIRSIEVVTSLQILEETYNYINRLEESHNAGIIEIILKDIKAPIRMDPFEVKQPEALYDYQFENLFSIILNLIEEENGLYNQAISEIDYTVQLIMNYLKKM